MYDKYFGLTDKPFSIAPDPRYLFMSEQHREALAHLVYGVGEGGGFVLLTGEVGTGKTTVCRCLLEQIPESTRIAFILNPKLSAKELLATVCDELHIQYGDQNSLKELNDALNEFLLQSHASGLKVVLMIDEAQNLSAELLEQIRLLTNLETNKEKLLQIILIGQPELNDILAQHELRQLAQRITARYHIKPLDLEECESYILHRLKVSGFNDSLFDKKAIRELFRRTGGVPRLINVLCDRAMLGAYARNRKQIGPNVVKKAASEIMGGDTHEVQADTIKPFHRPGHNWRLLSVALALILIVGSVYVFKLVYQIEEQSKQIIDQSSANHDLESKILTEQKKVNEKQSIELQKITDENQKLQETIDTMQEEKIPEPELEPETGPETGPEIVTTNIDMAESQSLEDNIQDNDQTMLQSEQKKPVLPFLTADIQPDNELDAQQELFGRWDLDYQPEANSNICDFAKAKGLRCELDNSGWWLLRVMDRPFILKLVSEDEQEIFGVVVALDRENVLINFSGEEILLSREQVSEYWSGEYFLLWQAPPDYAGPISLDMQGVQVQWLLTNLAKLENLDLIVPPDAVFDEKLKAKVEAFQKENALNPDGVAGLHTLITLNRLTNILTPTLSPRGVVSSGSAG